MSDEKWLKVPYFSRGKAESLERALTTGRFADGLDKALFFFATDTKQWIMVDVDKTIHVINSYEGQSPTPTPPEPGDDGKVKRVEYLPPITEADTSTLYILGTTVYSFDGESFYPTYHDVIGTVPPGTTVVEYINEVKVEAIETAKEYTNEQFTLHVVQGGEEDG